MRGVVAVMRWTTLGFLVFVGCSSSAKRSSTAAPVVSTDQGSTSGLTLTEPTAAERLASILTRLTPSTTPETLLIGIEVAPSVGYGPVYDEGPRAPPEDKLHTIVLRFEGGRAEFAGELPFLAIPQTSGVLYMGVASYDRDDTEAERRRQGPKFGMDDEFGSKVYWYAASSLWRTTDRAQVDATRNKARAALEARREWGTFFGEDINYVTSRAMCSTSYDAEWTGGALAFRAYESQALSGFEKELPQALSNHTDDAGLLHFAREIVRRREPGMSEIEISLDKPFDMIWAEVNWRKDSRTCLAREKGRVYLTGVIRLPNNSARSSEWEAPVREASLELAPSGAAPIELADVQRAYAVPKPRDILVSPGKSVLVAQHRDRVVVYGPGSATPLLSMPVSGRIVMAEWASGELARSWARIGDPPKAATSSSCNCDLGMICMESRCVKPKTVFVTSTLYTGNLGGLAGADAKCQERARVGGLSGEFKAWLSDSAISSASRLKHANAPYVLVDGTVLAKDWAELTSGELRVPIQFTELVQWPVRTPSPPGCAEYMVWTNTKEDGTIASKDRSCSNWTDGSSPPSPDKGAVWGQAEREDRWSSQCNTEYAGCNGSYPLFCIEQ
jgi:hypothetical protein